MSRARARRGGSPCVAGQCVTTTTTTTTTTNTTATTSTTTTTLLEETGFGPPSATASKCEDAVVKSVAKFAAAILKCHIKAADAAFKNKTSFAEEPCEVAAESKYDATNTKLFAPGHCPACLQANAVGMRQMLEPVLDGMNGQAYCAGTTPLP
jgi:hypothetical protein